MKAIKTKKCQYCGKDFSPYRSTDKHCSSNCFYQDKTVQKKVNRTSKKRQKESKHYKDRRLIFLDGKTCFVDGCNRVANTIEHTRGRQGYADDWARENKITLYLDERFWAPCCLQHNLEFEQNPELSKQYQLSKIHGGKK